MATASLTKVHLKVPTASVDCATWILQQEPVVVAEALTLAEMSFNAVQRERGSYVRSAEALNARALLDRLPIRQRNDLRELRDQLHSLKTLCTATDQNAVKNLISRMEKMVFENREILFINKEYHDQFGQFYEKGGLSRQKLETLLLDMRREREKCKDPLESKEL